MMETIQYDDPIWVAKMIQFSKKSPTGPTERTPNPEYLIALAIFLGVRWEGPIQFLMEIWTTHVFFRLKITQLI